MPTPPGSPFCPASPMQLPHYRCWNSASGATHPGSSTGRFPPAAAAVQLARLWFLPEVTVKLQYAYRPAPMAPATTGTSLVSAGIELGRLLFSSRRQLPAVDERSWQLEERRAELAARLLELHALLRQTYARWESLRDRERLYRTQLLPQAEALLDATLAPTRPGKPTSTPCLRRTWDSTKATGSGYGCGQNWLKPSPPWKPSVAPSCEEQP